MQQPQQPDLKNGFSLDGQHIKLSVLVLPQNIRQNYYYLVIGLIISVEMEGNHLLGGVLLGKKLQLSSRKSETTSEGYQEISWQPYLKQKLLLSNAVMSQTF
jgi:hypothetical protein